MSISDQLWAGEVGIESDWDFIVRCFEPDVEKDPELELDRYMTVMCECRICSERHLSSYPLTIFDETCQQCPHCEHMTCEPVTNDVIVVVDDLGDEPC